MNMRSYLDELGIRYAWSHHEPAFTAQSLAQKEHVSGRRVIKPVVVEADGQFVLCALPAAYYIDVERLRDELHAQKARLIDETQLSQLFSGCELGAEPPIGRLFGLQTIMDESVMNADRVTFQAGTHEDAVTMSLADYVRAAQPIIMHFARQRA